MHWPPISKRVCRKPRLLSVAQNWLLEALCNGGFKLRMKFSKSERSCWRAFVLISLETSISPFAFLSNICAHADGRAYPLSALNRILGISNGQWEVQGASASLNRSQQRGLIIGHALLPKEGNKTEEKKKKDGKKYKSEEIKKTS